MHADSHAERYLRLGLELGRHADDIVDAYFGPPELATAVNAADPVDPARLAASAHALLAELEDGWLRDQASALGAYAEMLAGDARPYADEVEACYQLRPRRTDDAVFAEVHGHSSTCFRARARLASATTPSADRLSCLRSVSSRWRPRRSRPRAPAPARWSSCRRGRASTSRSCTTCRGWATASTSAASSSISINADLPLWVIDLIRLVIHETYPGHHVERCLKDELLVRERGLLEETIVLLPTPQSVIAEGIASMAPSVLLDRTPEVFAGLADAAGVDIDFPGAVAVESALEPSRWVEVNAAHMLFADGRDEAEVRAYLEHWGVMDAELSAHAIRFIRGRRARGYVICYPAGRELCAAYVGAEPARFRQLLSEQVRVGELLAAAG